MKPDKAEASRRFKKLRHLALMTQSELGHVIGICRQAVWEIEHERTLPHGRTWGRFAAVEGKILADYALAPRGLWQ